MTVGDRNVNAAALRGTIRVEPPTDGTGAVLPVAPGFTGVVVSDGTVDRVELGQLSATEYGLRVTNSGSTVIIDGTSDMFRIQATGTLSVLTLSPTFPETTSSVTLSGLGVLATSPAHLSLVSYTNTPGSPRFLGDATSLGDSFVAVTSGGAVTTRRLTTQWEAHVRTTLDGSDFCVVTLAAVNVSGLTFTFPTRYYVLEQTAI